MSKYVVVDAISQFRMRYVVEVPDGVENPTEEGTYPCTPIEYASDSVTCEDVKEFTQKHLGETIVDAREVTLDEAIALFRSEEPYFAEWSDATIIKNHITEIGYDRVEHEKQMELKFQEKYGDSLSGC